MKTDCLIWGKVKTGSQRGKSLGFPTVNIALHKEVADGVYLSRVRIDKKLLPALTFVGAAKTFESKTKKVESFILDFNTTVYGKWITVRLLKKIRGNIKFKSSKELTSQMKKDLSVANVFFQEKLLREF